MGTASSPRDRQMIRCLCQVDFIRRLCRRFKFQKGGQLFPPIHDETLSVSMALLSRRNSATNREGPGFTGTYPGAMLHEISTASINRLSAPVSARSLLPKSFNPESSTLSTQKNAHTKYALAKINAASI